MWKWFNYDKINAKGLRKSKLTGEEKKFLCVQVWGKVTGKEGPLGYINIIIILLLSIININHYAILIAYISKLIR